MRKLLWLIIGLTLTISLSGCGRKYTGTWVASGVLGGGTIVINSDGTGVMSGGLSGAESIIWHTEGDQIVITDAQGNNGVRGSLSRDGKSLILTDSKTNEMVVLVRQD